MDRSLSLETHQYDILPTLTAFRVAEVLPGQPADPVEVKLHIVDWEQLLEYEAISYHWGVPEPPARIHVVGKKIEVTQNLQWALAHLRLPDRSRFLWADALCINQSNIPERSWQVRQMRRIYESTMTVLIWIGPDTPDGKAEVAVDSIIAISDFVCGKLGIDLSKPDSIDGTFQEFMLKHRESLPLPDKSIDANDRTWECLRWLYKHPYFTRIWVVQEISTAKARRVHVGSRTVEWERVDLVASYLIMDTAFSTEYQFSDTYCWWVATLTEMVRQPKNWIFMLYLASNFFCKDHRDYVYGLRGLMHFERGAELLQPDYSKSVEEVYRDSVEAALTNFRNTNILLYVNGRDSPSWVPRWDKPMLFRNPFRFGKPLPFRPAGDSESEWKVDREMNTLSLSGYILDKIKVREPYYETHFGDRNLKTEDQRLKIRQFWHKALQAMADSESQTPVSSQLLTRAAVTFSFGLDSESQPAQETLLVQNFIAYLVLMLEDGTISKFVPPDLIKQAENGKGDDFGKPVWDFEYPESSFYITETGLLGCAATRAQPGDTVFVPLGSTYAFILRPEGEDYRLQGFSFMHGRMYGDELPNTKETVTLV